MMEGKLMKCGDKKMITSETTPRVTIDTVGGIEVPTTRVVAWWMLIVAGRQEIDPFILGCDRKK